jgi:hypothetical protein
MRKVEDLERQIRELSKEEYAEFRAWFLERDWAEWDAKVEADSRSGKLDRVVAEGRKDYKAGRAREL